MWAAALDGCGGGGRKGSIYEAKWADFSKYQAVRLLLDVPAEVGPLPGRHRSVGTQHGGHGGVGIDDEDTRRNQTSHIGAIRRPSNEDPLQTRSRR